MLRPRLIQTTSLLLLLPLDGDVLAHLFSRRLLLSTLATAAAEEEE
jgi:hypothetical protein